MNYTNILRNPPEVKKKLSIPKIRQHMRELWADHVIYTRAYIVSYFAGLKDINIITKRLMKNQEDIGAVFGKIYGRQSGELVTTLLKEHISIAAKLLEAVKEGNSDNIRFEKNKWDENAKSIAISLSKLNYNWTPQGLYTHLHKHLELTEAEAIAQYNEDYFRSISMFDRAMDQAMEMADLLAAGIYKQFPKKF